MSTIRIKYLLIFAVVLITGCAGQQGVMKNQGGASTAGGATEPDMSAAIAAVVAGKPLKAEAMLSKLTQSHPQAAMPWVNLGLIRFRRGEWDEAQQAAEHALVLQPETAAANYLLGVIAHHKEQAPDALKFYRAALEQDQQHAATHYNLALLFDTYYQDVEQAIIHYRHYLALIPDEDEETSSWLSELEMQFEELNGADDES